MWLVQQVRAEFTWASLCTSSSSLSSSLLCLKGLLSSVEESTLLFSALCFFWMSNTHTHTEWLCTELICHLQGCVQELPNNHTGYWLILTFCGACFCFLEGGGFSSDDAMISTLEPQTGEKVRPKPDFMQIAAKTVCIIYFTGIVLQDTTVLTINACC